MTHKITIEIESEKEWQAVCALSSLLGMTLSKLAKKDLIENTKSLSERLKKDDSLISELSGGLQSQNVKRLLSILK